MKQKLLSFVLILMLLPWMMLTAQNCREYSTATMTSSSQMPFASSSNRYAWAQMIYTPYKIGGTGTIRSISFLATAHQPLTDSPIVVYMGTMADSVAASAKGWLPQANLTEVFRDSNYHHLRGSGWETITLDVPFQYDGTANLVVCISSSHLGIAPGMTYACTNAVARTCICRMGSTSAYAAHPGNNSGTNIQYLPFATFCFDGACNTPGTPAATNIMATSADVAWATSNAASYQYLCLSPNDTLDWTNAQTTTSLSVSLNGLTPNTAYRFYVRSVCSTSVYSNEVLTCFRTACPTTQSLPYSVDFEDQVIGGANAASYPTFVDCWDRICDASSVSNQGWPYVYSTTSNAHSGSKTLYFVQKNSNSTNFDKNIAVLPQFSQAVNTLQLSFWAKKSSALTAGFIIVGVMTDPTDATTFTAVDTLEFASANNQYTRCISYFNRYTGTGNHIAICCAKNRTGITAPIYFYVDDIEVDVLPSCLTPGNLTTDTVAARFATMSWTPNGQESAWNIRYRLATDTAWTVVPDTVTYPYTINNLIPNKKYEVSVRAACDSTDFSLWTQPMQFHTQCAPVTAQELGTISFEGSEGYITGPGNLTNCWTVGNLKTTSTTFFPYAYNGSVFANTGSVSLQMTTGDIDSAYAILPEIDFTNTLLADYDLQFYLKGTGATNSANDNNDTLWVGVVSDRADFSTFQKLGYSAGNNASDYILVSFSFAESQLASGHIALFTTYNHSATATYANYQYHIDDLRVVYRKHSVIVNVNDSTMGSVAGAGIYYRDSIATLTATPAAGHHFVNWSNGATTPTISIVVSQDTSFTANFAVSPTYLFEESDTICQGDTLTWREMSLTETGVYYDSLKTVAYGADSVYKMTLTVNPSYFITEADTICEGETYLWHTRNLTAAGVYYDSLISVNGCDSVYELTLTVNPSYFITEADTICEGETYVWHMRNLTAAGVYYDSLFSVNGCDSVYELTLTVNPTYLFSDSMAICNEPISWHGQIITTPGTYHDSLVTVSGCDSVYELHVNLERHTVTAIANDETMGFVTGGGIYYCGDTVTVTVTAFDYHTFTGWDNGATDSVITFVVTGDTTLTAEFARDKFNVYANIEGAGTVSGLGLYEHGATVELTATAANDYVFAGWSTGDTMATLTFTMETHDTTVTATFVPASDVEQIEAENSVAYVESFNIVVSGAAGHSVAVFDMNGKLVGKVENASDIESIAVNTAGVFIIRVDNMTAIRVVVK